MPPSYPDVSLSALIKDYHNFLKLEMSEPTFILMCRHITRVLNIILLRFYNMFLHQMTN